MGVKTVSTLLEILASVVPGHKCDNTHLFVSTLLEILGDIQSGIRKHGGVEAVSTLLEILAFSSCCEFAISGTISFQPFLRFWLHTVTYVGEYRQSRFNPS